MFPISDSIRAPRFPLINLVLIAITVFVFLQQNSASDPDGFITQFAFIPSLINFSDSSTLYPFITSMFLHGGFLHIVSNMWFLWVFGDNVEGRVGALFFPVLYIFSGVVGNAAQYVFMSDSDIPMLGASGAVAGVLGAYYVFFPHAKIKTLVPFFGFITFVNIPAPFMLGYWFILQVISGAVSLPFSQDGGIAFWAHVGGFVAGIIVAKLFGGAKAEWQT